MQFAEAIIDSNHILQYLLRLLFRMFWLNLYIHEVNSPLL